MRGWRSSPSSPILVLCTPRDTLLSLFHGLLAHLGRTLQSAALRCVPGTSTAQRGLWRLLDGTTWRDELANIDFTTLEPEVADVVVRLLYGILRERKGQAFSQ